MARTYTPEEKAEARRLFEENNTVREIADIMDIPPRTVRGWVKGPTPGKDSSMPPPRSVYVEPPPHAEDVPEEPRVRVADEEPHAPSDARLYALPDDGINYKQLQDYIEGFYKLGANLAGQTDAALGEAINAHAEAAGEAWAEWIRSEPKVAALMQRLMIGTPLGKVIGVHVSLVIAYVLARNAQRDVAARSAADDAADDGATEYGAAPSAA